MLPFLDLVAYLIELNLGLVDDGSIDLNHFKFVLLASFKSPEEAIGRELCLGLQYIVKALGRANFEYHERFSNATLNNSSIVFEPE